MVFTFKNFRLSQLVDASSLNHIIPVHLWRVCVPYELGDIHRRIRNILDVCPAASWTLDESVIVLDALAAIVRTRQAAGDVIDLAARRSLR